MGCILFGRVGVSSPHAEGVGASAWQLCSFYSEDAPSGGSVEILVYL